MFTENPFTGACGYATYEVLAMLVGTLVLGLLLGYLIWGWLRKQVSAEQKRTKKYQHIAELRQVQIVNLTTRLTTVKDQLERAETKVALAEYKMRKAQEELESVKDQMVLAQQRLMDHTEETRHREVREITSPESTNVDSDAGIIDEPSLADISLAMDKGALNPTHQKPDASQGDLSIDESLIRGTSEESLEMAAKVFEHDVEANDLKMIYGVDPKMEDMLRRAGYLSWLDLAQSRLPDIRRIVEEAGPRYRAHDPKTWAIQARMAAKGEWKKLKAYQDALQQGE